MKKPTAERALTTDELARAFEAQCLQALARREHSRRELLAKKTAELDEDAALAVLDGLAERGWQSDLRYCHSYVRSKSAAGNGALKIKQGLQHSGIAPDMLREALAEVDWFALAAAVYAKKYAQPAKDAAERAKRQRFMAQRGFSFEEIRHAEDALSEQAHD